MPIHAVHAASPDSLYGYDLLRSYGGELDDMQDASGIRFKKYTKRIPENNQIQEITILKGLNCRAVIPAFESESMPL